MPDVTRRRLLTVFGIGAASTVITPGATEGRVADSIQSSAEWQQTYEGGDGDAAFFDVLQTVDGGYLAVGNRSVGGGGNAHGWFVKTDETGSEVWSDTLRGDGGGNTQLSAVFETDDGTYRMFGEVDQEIGGLTTDSNGEVQRTWLSGIPGKAIGATLAWDGTSVVAGETSGSDETHTVGILAKVSDNELDWVHRVEPSASDGIARFNDVIRGSDGGYIAAGMRTRDGKDAPLLLKLDERGRQQWSVDAVGDEELEERLEFLGLARAPDDGYLAVGEIVETGETRPNGHVNKFTADGSHMWSVNSKEAGDDYEPGEADGFRDAVPSEGGFTAAGYHATRGGLAAEITVNEIPDHRAFGDGEFSAIIGTAEGDALLAGERTSDGATAGWLALVPGGSVRSTLTAAGAGDGNDGSTPSVTEINAADGGSSADRDDRHRGFFSNSGNDPAFLTNVFNLTILGFLISVAGIIYQMMEG